MTTESLAEIFGSRPRRRVAMICLLWTLAIALAPVKAALKLPAYPFIWVANIVYELKRRIAEIVGDIMGEVAERQLKNEEEEGDGL